MKLLAPILLLLLACPTGAVAKPSGPAQVGVAFDRNGERGVWAEGLADPSTRRAVTPDDPVRVASVSKLVVAIGVMKLVEQGKLDLDRDVSTYLGWNLRNPAFPDQPITLRQLLSHTSSVRDGDDAYVVPLGETVQAALAETQVWDLEHGPNEHYFAYSNFNFPIVGSIVERVTGERFDIWMRREVLAPMKLDACFNWPTCSDTAVARAVVLTQDGQAVRDDLHGRQPDCPVFVDKGPCDLARWTLGENGGLFSPQGGLRISARGLERIGRMLLNDGVLDRVRILSPKSVATMLAPAWQYKASNGSRDSESAGVCSYGLATRQLVDGDGCAEFADRGFFVWDGHAGDAYGLRSGVWIDRERGLGIAYFVTGLADDPPTGGRAFVDLEEQAFRRSEAQLNQDIVLSGLKQMPGKNDRFIPDAMVAAQKCGFDEVHVRPSRPGDFGNLAIEPDDVTLLGKFRSWWKPKSGLRCFWEWQLNYNGLSAADIQNRLTPADLPPN